MNEEDIRDQQIERYVHERMDEREQIEFEQQMSVDEALRLKVNDEMELQSLYDKDLIEFKKKLESIQLGSRDISSSSGNKSIEGETPSSTPVRPGQVIRMKYVWAIAASAALLVSIFWFFNRPPNLQQLAMNAAKESFEITRGNEDELTLLFSNGEYQKYIDKATALLVDSANRENTVQIKINIALCHVLLNQSQLAISTLEALPQAETSICDVRFIMALAYLEMSDVVKAKEYLKQVTGKNCFPIDQEANELLNKF